VLVYTLSIIANMSAAFNTLGVSNNNKFMPNVNNFVDTYKEGAKALVLSA
jgi:hypothetical protein